jgi:hypothetical protein
MYVVAAAVMEVAEVTLVMRVHLTSEKDYLTEIP